MKRLRYLLAAGAMGLGLGFSLYAYRVMALEERDAPIVLQSNSQGKAEEVETKKVDDAVEKISDSAPPVVRSIKTGSDEFLLPGPLVDTPSETKKPKSESHLIAEAKKIAELYAGADTTERREKIKEALREKLKAILAMQEARRAAEIAAAEAKLARMKEIAAKRKEAAESIVDRRLEVMTGGVDELAWEEPHGASGEARKAVYYPATSPALPGPVNYPAPPPASTFPSR